LVKARNRPAYRIAGELHGSGNMQFLAKGVLCIIEIPSSEALIQDE